jgi:hypothetical protein
MVTALQSNRLDTGPAPEGIPETRLRLASESAEKRVCIVMVAL